MENDMIKIANRVYVGECAGRPWKRWIVTVKDCWKKRFGCQARKENDVWPGFGRGNAWGVAWG